MSQLMELCSEKYSPKRIKRMLMYCLCVCIIICMYVCMYIGSVHRYYESRRRFFDDNKPDRIPQASKVQKEARKGERRKRVSPFFLIKVLLVFFSSTRAVKSMYVS